MYFFPLVAAVFGWLFNMAFARFILRKTLPERIPVLAGSAGNFLSHEIPLMNFNTEGDSGKAVMAGLTPIIESHIDVFLNEKLKEKMPAIAMFVGEKTIGMMKVSLMEEINLLLPELLKKFTGGLKEKIDPEQMILSAIRKMPEGKMEQMIWKATRKERALFHALGALLGLLIGGLFLLLASFCV